jgi:hypothetical protein
MRIELFLLALIVSPLLSIAGTRLDTITIHVDTACTDFMPHRGSYFVHDEETQKLIRLPDSIRVGNQLVYGYNKHYYLIAYDMNGTKRLEGNFWDEHAEGYFADFDYRGRKISEGHYKLVKKHKICYPSAKTGTWNYYDINGKVLRKEEYNFSRHNMIHEQSFTLPRRSSCSPDFVHVKSEGNPTMNNVSGSILLPREFAFSTSSKPG